MNRKKVFILMLLLLLLLLPLSSCDNDKELFDYTIPTLSKEEVIKYDSNMNIDAKDDEDVYQGQEVLTFTEIMSGITCYTKAFLGESGLFVYTYVDDPNVYYSSERQFFENDSVEYYIDPNPEYSSSVEHLGSSNLVRTDCLQLRINVMGETSTWYGRRIGEVGSYPWAPGFFTNVVAANVDGTINEQNGAKGYSIEAFIPYYEMNLEAKPEKIGILVAFNNIDNREDTGRTWCSHKGMSHGSLNSYIPVEEVGFNIPHYSSDKELIADYNADFYKNAKEYTIEQVNENNLNPEDRANFKFVLGDDGLYVTALVKDRVYNYTSDNIFANDGIEILVDTRERVTDYIFVDGVYRFSYDIAGGTQTDICKSGYYDYVTQFNPTLVKTKVEEYKEESLFNYKFQYTYEVMIPYEILGLKEKPEKLNVAFAVKTPNEKAYILNRRDGVGNMEAQDWLWIDKHYPQNGSEFFSIYDKDLVVDSGELEENWENYITNVVSDAPERYQILSHAATEGLYIKIEQYVNNYIIKNDSSDWNSTHVEMELWNHCIGYGWDGTYFAFFANGSYYINNWNNCNNVYTDVKIQKNPEGSTYKYTITYNIYIAFNNNLNNPQDGPYAFCQFMFYTPEEGNSGYENATTITKDGWRILWTDKCSSYEIRNNGIVKKDGAW